MTLTVKEKEHWKHRISRRIDQTMQSLITANDPSFLDRLGKDARQQALQSLGLYELYKRVTEIREQRKDLVRKENLAYQEMIAVLQQCDIHEVPEKDRVHVASIGYSYFPDDVERVVKLRQEVHEKELLGESSLGKKILELRKEKEELLDTVWLATSGKQIKELWQNVDELLNLKPTELQAKALSIDSEEEDPV